MEKHKFTITVNGSKTDATKKIKALAKIIAKLTVKEAEVIAHVVENDPSKIALAMQFLGA